MAHQRSGSVLPIKLQKAWKKQRGLCHYCRRKTFIPSDTERVKGTNPLAATLDHKIPVSKNGTNANRNLVMACRECNQHRGNMDYDVFLDTARSNRE